MQARSWKSAVGDWHQAWAVFHAFMLARALVKSGKSELALLAIEVVERLKATDEESSAPVSENDNDPLPPTREQWDEICRQAGYKMPYPFRLPPGV